MKKMKLKIEVNNKDGSPIRKDFLRKAVKATLSERDLDFLADKDIELSFALVSPEEIKKINRIYRKKNKTTDVLSFPEYENRAELMREVGRELFLGEIILCYNDIRDYVSLKKEKNSLERELANVISHGVLHLLGFRHGQKMFFIQTRVVAEIFS